MSANEKPSERAAMYLLTCKEFWQTIISITKKAGGDRAIESNTLHAFIAFSIDRVTGCDSLAEENQRLRGVLGELSKRLEYEFHQDCLYARLEKRPKPEPKPSESLTYIRSILAVEALKAKSDKASFPAD